MTNGANLGKHASDAHEPSASGREPTLTYRTFRKPGTCGPVAWLDVVVVADAGRVHLKELTKLQALYLRRTKVTDAGLAHLKGLTELKNLSLTNTKITRAGIAERQQALSNCRIRK